MKVLIAGLFVAASVAAVSAPASAAPTQSRAPSVSAQFETVAYGRHRHHRQQVCVMRHHHRVCHYR